MKYIRVENNSVVGFPQELPISAENISNFYLLPNEVLRSYGWYPYEEEEINITKNETLVRWDIIIESDKVVKRFVKRELTQEEIDHKNNVELQKKWEDIRSRRNSLLLESDWTQLSDAQIENKSDWISYRQELRNITQNPNPDTIVWPPKPVVVKSTFNITETPIIDNSSVNTLPPPVEEESGITDGESLPE
jgi:hypothetical protein